MKTSLTIAATAAALFFAAPVLAADEYNVVPGLTAAGAPLALHGVDPVAFKDLNNRVEGSAAYTAVHDGVAYYFDTQANMETFKKSPAKYVAEQGGFCTFGVSVGKKFDGDPRYADIRNGKLYLFLNEEIFRMYQKDKDGTIAKADAQWKKIKHTAAKDL